METKKIDVNFVREVYNAEGVAEYYIESVERVGLWASERIMIEKYFSFDDQILDIACGAGRSTFGLYNLGYKKIEGLDIADVLINAARDIARKKGINLNFYIGDATKLEFNDMSYSGCFISHCGLMAIPGINNRISALKEIYRILKPNSYLIFVTSEDRNKFLPKIWEWDKKKWEKNEQDDRLIEYGDMLFKENGIKENFGHFPTTEEVLACLHEANFVFCEFLARSEICEESEIIMNNSFDPVRFWVAKKEI